VGGLTACTYPVCAMRAQNVVFLFSGRSTKGIRHMLPAALSVLLLSLTGCTTVPPYPAQLQAVVPPEARPEASTVLAGCYKDKGSIFSTAGKCLGEVSLTGVLHQYDPAPFAAVFPGRHHREFIHHKESLTNADVVAVTGPKSAKSFWEGKYDLYKAQSWQGQALLATNQMKIEKHGSYVKEGFVYLLMNSRGDSSPVSAGLSENVLLLRKSADGSLIALRRDMGARLLIRDVWYWFPVCSEQRDKALKNESP
jgi:hypothetical protein